MPCACLVCGVCWNAFPRLRKHVFCSSTLFCTLEVESRKSMGFREDLALEQLQSQVAASYMEDFHALEGLGFRV
eukprot:6018262-Amphidinium_carterae.1